jgi:hypothetical protein
MALDDIFISVSLTGIVVGLIYRKQKWGNYLFKGSLLLLLITVIAFFPDIVKGFKEGWSAGVNDKK